jgi:sulfate/thiosulfate transport system permease protein
MKRKERSDYILIGLVVGFLSLMILLPMTNLLMQAFREGITIYLESISHPDTLSAIGLNLVVAFFTIPLNLIFGISAAICIARFQFPGKTILTTLIDIPFSVSPVISGLIFILVFGLNGWWGEWIESKGFQIIFATPGIVLATIFITFPFIAREVLPVLEAAGDDEEVAAHILGANSLQTFFYITLPKMKWGLLYGVILCTARVMGEFGAVSVVSGHIAGLTDTLPLRIEKLYNEYQTVAAFSVATLLAAFAFITLFIKIYVEHLEQKSEI